MDDLNQRSHRQISCSFNRSTHGSQRRVEQPGSGWIVEADQSDILRYAFASALQGAQGADRRVIIGGEDGLCSKTIFQPALYGLPGNLFIETTQPNQAGIYREAMRNQGFSVTQLAPIGIFVILRASQESDPPVAMRLDQMVGDLPCAGFVLEDNVWDF